jgi:hypothetical protein
MRRAEILEREAELRAEGQLIDPGSCEIGFRWAPVLDVYRLRDEVEGCSIGRECFVRRDADSPWVCIIDLPEEARNVLWSRIAGRQAEYIGDMTPEGFAELKYQADNAVVDGLSVTFGPPSNERKH